MKQPRFLIIQLRQIGDVLISTTLCETLKKNYPQAQVDYVVYPYAAAVAEHNPYIDNVIVVPNGNQRGALWKLLKAIRFMRRQRYDYAVDILTTPKSALLAKFSGAKTIIGQDIPQWRTRCYHKRVKYDPQFFAADPACNSVKNRLYLLTALDKPLKYTTHYHVYLSDAEIAQARERLLEQGGDVSKPIFFFSLGSRSPNSKQWPLDYFITVMNECIVKYDAQLITCPSGQQQDDDYFVQQQLLKPKQLFVIPNTSLREMAALIKQCQLFVGNDSGARHIAIGVDTPTVAIFAPQINYHDWHLADNPLHLAVTIQQALAWSDGEYAQKDAFLAKQNVLEIYRRITPDMVLSAIATNLRLM
jgi:heptosyltransferase-3